MNDKSFLENKKHCACTWGRGGGGAVLCEFKEGDDSQKHLRYFASKPKLVQPPEM